jgi:TonB family protein
LIQIEGKYLIVTLRGVSGDLAAAGSISVAAGHASSAATEMSGSLNGRPCAIEFIRLENIADASIVESPGPSNQWSRIVVRVRPKDAKRLIRFSINWRMLQSASGDSKTELMNAFSEAEPIQKPPPVFPAAARAVRASGTVTVSLVVDERGDVISARATDGPMVFRQAAEEAARHWQFRPATRNGTPVQSVQTIHFKFQT